MKRVWGFGTEKGLSPLGSASGLQRQGRGVGQENNRTDNLLLGYHVRDRDLRKIHKAACVGNVAQVQQILLLGENGVDDRDKMNRTALHLACANGHPEVVTLLVERKCHLNLCDHEKRTALMKAVQCQEEKCVNILLENGADPNIRDVSGNTALHYAAFGDNISIIEKLLLYNANTEARNKDNFTPLLVAVNENKQQIVEVLVEKAANIHAEDKLKSSDEIICHHKEEIMLKNSLQNSNPGTDKNSEEDSITSTEMKIQILGQINSECQRLSDKPGPDDSWPTSASQDFDFGTEVEEKKKHRGSDMEVSENIHDAAVAGLIPQRQNGKADNHQLPITEKKDSDRSEPGLHRKKLKEGENENGTSKGSVITPVLKKADSLTGGPLQKNDGSHFSEKDQHESRPAKKISKKKNKGKKQITSKDDLVDLIQSSETASEDCGLPYSKNFMLLIEQLGMDCKDSAGFLKIQNILVSYKRLRKLNKNHCKRVTGKIKKMEKTVSALQNELREAKDVTSRLEHQKMEWEHEVCCLRFALKQEEEKRRNADLLYEKSREKLRRIEDQYKKEVKTKQEFELALRTRNMELKAAKDNLNQLSDSREEIQDLLHKNHMLQDEIAMLRLERDTIKNQNQRKETKYCEDIESVKEKNDNLQKTIKQNEETLSKTIFRYTGQLNVLTAEITRLKSKLENEKQNKESLEAEVESYRARLATAVHNHDESQTSRKDLELAFQRARDEDGHLQDQMNFDVSKLQDNNEVLSRQLSQDESKFNALEIELHHTKDALREKTFVLECVQRDLSQTQCQKMEIEHMYQKEQSNVNKYIAKQESFEERLSQLQSENMLLRQQLDAAHNQADSEEKLVINMQDQFQNIQKYLKAKREEQGLMLGERNKELIDECKHLKERMYKYKNEKGKLEVVVRELQQKLADTLKKQSMSHASPEVISHLRLEDETRDLKKKLGRIRSQADVLTTELETTSSKRLHLDAKNQILQQELLSMKAFEEEREKLESNNKKLQREVVKLKQFMEMNMVERSQVEQYKREIEERARLDTVQKLHEVNLFLQAQAAAQENLDQLRKNAHASTRSQMELRIEDLESQVSTMKTSQEDSTKTELETYRQLYLEELKVRKSLRSELNRTNERLSESNTKLLAEKQQHQTSLRTLTMSLGLETPYCGHFGNNSVLNGNLTPRRNLGIPTLNPRPSYAYWETSLWKMQRELEKGVTRALEEVAPEFERGSCRTPLVSTDDSILNQDPVWKASREYVQILNKNYMI
ncbi:ankyrin repeat domain-containing protein 26-like isoform X6 [Prionailurus bengalensis]|uniref:ankyrin repeat domain-containing protein 26-like isoform X6 n=1 Tax=Prionailurus bengalensis TaxID=37029 RepID=UPI001CA8C51C|nr:ankyrin repeat domain-containing protein 26-like isoform X6 [Prionailurus bengalensis]